MRRTIANALLVAALAAPLPACHTMRFTLGDEPVGETVVERKSYFFWGLAPTRKIDVLAKCPAGVVAIREQTTFVDGLCELPTLGIWSPRSTTYYCRAGATEASR